MNPEEFQLEKDRMRGNFLPYTRKAFSMISGRKLERILDIGCGRGIPTLELARLSGAKIVGLDVDEDAILELARMTREKGLSNRVETVLGSLLEMEFPKESFDVIWAEGSIAFLGFENGLREWGKLLRPGGFLAVHHDAAGYTVKRAMIPRCGYELLGEFTLSKDDWWFRYFAPMKELIEGLFDAAAPDPVMKKMLEREAREISIFGERGEGMCSVFFVMRKV